MTTDTMELAGNLQAVETEVEIVEVPTATQQLHFLVDWLGTLFTGGLGVDTFDGEEGSIDQFMNKIDERLEAGDFNSRTAYLFLDLFLGGLLAPDVERLNQLAGRGAKLDVDQMLHDLSVNDPVFSKVMKKRDYYGKVAHDPS
ncbi:MAG: hypothetical protein ACTS9Y_00730 [Methylophilus sp.]|uniref:hypothetical protein n=1 Tax=Methylophilus sp. TaxID=29541 RepID=UPI003FA1521E